MPAYHALVRTHHITSRKKVAHLKAAAKKFQCSALLRSGGAPGIMYVRGDDKDQVQKWIDTVHDLRYKDYQLIARVGSAQDVTQDMQFGTLQEVDTVKEMASIMEKKGLLSWWRNAMGFAHDQST